jgi:hypothetical protein
MAHRLIFILIFFAIAVILSLLYFFYSLLKSHRKWKEGIKNNPQYRMSKNEKEFIDFYLKLGYEESSIDFVYCHVKIFLKVQDLVLLHTDDIVNLYERNEDEWFFILNTWLEQLGYTKLSESNFKERCSNSLDFEFLIRTIQLQGLI